MTFKAKGFADLVDHKNGASKKEKIGKNTTPRNSCLNIVDSTTSEVTEVRSP